MENHRGDVKGTSRGTDDSQVGIVSGNPPPTSWKPLELSPDHEPPRKGVALGPGAVTEDKIIQRFKMGQTFPDYKNIQNLQNRKQSSSAGAQTALWKAAGNLLRRATLPWGDCPTPALASTSRLLPPGHSAPATAQQGLWERGGTQRVPFPTLKLPLLLPCPKAQVLGWDSHLSPSGHR